MAPFATVPAAALQLLLRNLAGQMGDLAGADPLRPGEIVAGRVTLGPGGERLLMLSGVRVPATLPADVPLDRALRFEVTESGPERLVLKVVDAAAQGTGAQASAPGQHAAHAHETAATPWASFPLPGGAQARIFVAPDDLGGPAPHEAPGGHRTLVVRYDAPAVGRLDIVLRLGDEQLDVTTFAAPGVPLQTVREETAPLRQALAAATGRPVALQSAPWLEEELDVRA